MEYQNDVTAGVEDESGSRSSEGPVTDQVMSDDWGDSSTNAAATQVASRTLNTTDSNCDNGDDDGDGGGGISGSGEEEACDVITAMRVDSDSGEFATANASIPSTLEPIISLSNTNEILNDTPSGKVLLLTPKSKDGITPDNSKNMENLVVKMMQEKCKMSVPDLDLDSSSTASIVSPDDDEGTHDENQQLTEDQEGEEQSGCLKDEAKRKDADEEAVAAHNFSSEECGPSSNEKKAAKGETLLCNLAAEDHELFRVEKENGDTVNPVEQAVAEVIQNEVGENEVKSSVEDTNTEEEQDRDSWQNEDQHISKAGSPTCDKPTQSTRTVGNKALSSGELIARGTMGTRSLTSVTRRRISAFGSFGRAGSFGNGRDKNSKSNLALHGEGRRQVLNTIFYKGMRSPNLIWQGVAPAARRAVQAMDRRRAVKLLEKQKSGGESEELGDGERSSVYLSSTGSTETFTASNSNTSEEDECIDSVRLVLIQNRVARGHLSPESAARALTMSSAQLEMDESWIKHANKEVDLLDLEGPDAGELDSRLAGCGPVSEAISSALKLWKIGSVSDGELLDLVQKDIQFTLLALPGAENENKLQEDSAFWGRFAFGERWAEKKARIQASSPLGAKSGWDLTGVIVKSNDDLRQEAFAMQLIELCGQTFEMSGLELWTQPYRILATGRTTGIIEMVRNAMSFDSLKKRPGYNSGGLLGHFQKMSECAADPGAAFKSAQKNFIRSTAAYSLISYFFIFKDRHNGNILLDTAGHVIHIDFGFVFGIAPGGSFSLEQSVPFKMTEEMIEVMGGLGSVQFSEFVTLFCCGFLALQAHAETFLTIVEITCEGSTFKCFEGKDTSEIIDKLRDRFCLGLNKEETIAYAMELIRQATISYGTKQYDFFQYLSQGIAA